MAVVAVMAIPFALRGNRKQITGRAISADGCQMTPPAKLLRMKPASLGVRMHSGWGVLVAVSGASDTPAVIVRRHLVVIEEGMRGGKQPYHHAERIGLSKAEKFLAEYIAICDCRAREIIANTIQELTSRGYRVSATGLVLASGRELPPLEQILAAHPLIHTAEGELFRVIVRRACEALDIKVIGYRERELAACAKKRFGRAAQTITNCLANAGQGLGSPWTVDHKSAALAAHLALQEK